MEDLLVVATVDGASSFLMSPMYLLLFPPLKILAILNACGGEELITGIDSDCCLGLMVEFPSTVSAEFTFSPSNLDTNAVSCSMSVASFAIGP